MVTELLARISYKRGWRVLLHRIDRSDDYATSYLQVHYDGTGDYGSTPWSGRKWLLSVHMTPTEIVYTAFKAIMAAEEHETREMFLVDGVPVCGPHYDALELVALIKHGQLGVDVRSDAMEGAQ